ncbi:MAG: NUDIX domain-containing protein [Prolixibacteraceae bacterium]|nr:NUDIX domain-containing protein [Prolixibacteraceae bacterium]
MYNHTKQLLSVDCIIFGYENDDLKLLLFERWIEPAKGQLSLLGGWVNDDESVNEAARRVLQMITGLKDVFMEQVDIFSDVNRDPGGRVVSIAYYALINIEEQNKKLVQEHGATWVSLHKMPDLIFDHNLMVEKALEKLRFKASYELIGEQLLPEKFTMLQLRKLYNAIYQKEFDPGNFRKKVLSLNVLEQLNIKDTSKSKKGAYYYRFLSQQELLSSNERIFKVQFNR